MLKCISLNNICSPCGTLQSQICNRKHCPAAEWWSTDHGFDFLAKFLKLYLY